jgi:hypothetical protein
MPGTLTSEGNLLLSFAILVAGGSASKVIRIFQHMGLGCISLPTFFRHQRVSSEHKKYINLSKSSQGGNQTLY